MPTQQNLVFAKQVGARASIAMDGHNSLLGVVVMGWWLDEMILELLSNRNDSMSSMFLLSLHGMPQAEPFLPVGPGDGEEIHT